jgi:hypothetical protein
MGQAQSMHEMRKSHKILIRKPKGKRLSIDEMSRIQALHDLKDLDLMIEFIAPLYPLGMDL